MALLTVKGLGKAWGNNWVVSDLSFSSEPLEQIAIVGETGSGKTSLLKMLGGLMQPDAGSIFLGEEKIKGPDEVLIPGHKKIGYLSQHFELRNNYRVHEVLEMASRMEQEAADKILQVCKVDHLLQRWTDELSGGEKQRLAIVRALMQDTKIMMFDEPTNHLDIRHQRFLLQYLQRLVHRQRKSILVVLHDLTHAHRYTDEVVLLNQGSVVAQGLPDVVMTSQKLSEVYHVDIKAHHTEDGLVFV